MTKDELAEFLCTTEAGARLGELFRELNSELQYALSPRILDDTYHKQYISNWIYDKLHDFVAEADGLLHKKPAEVIVTGEDVYECPECGYQSYKPKISVPMRKFIKSEPLTTQQFVIADAVRTLGKQNRKLAAIKLIRGTFQDDDGGFCRLTEAKDIYDAIIARGE